MKALIIGSKERYEKFMPQNNPFVDEVEKVYVDLGTPDEEILKVAGDADVIGADAIAKVSKNLIEHMPNLKLIQSEGVAYNGIDVNAATEAGVRVCNNKGINASAVAEQAIMLMLGLLRTVIPGHKAVLAGEQIQMKERRMVEGIAELADCKVGLVGFGDIAKETAKLLCAFGAEVYYYSRGRKPIEEEGLYHAMYLPLDDLLAICDIVSIHVPVTPETTGMCDKTFFKKMQNTAYLINTARGEIVVNEDLKDALVEGEIAGAGLDTIAPEPVLSDNILVNLPESVQDKILYAPHLGGITRSTFVRAHANIWKAFEDVEEGFVPKNSINMKLGEGLGFSFL